MSVVPETEILLRGLREVAFHVRGVGNMGLVGPGDDDFCVDVGSCYDLYELFNEGVGGLFERDVE